MRGSRRVRTCPKAYNSLGVVYSPAAQARRGASGVPESAQPRLRPRQGLETSSRCVSAGDLAAAATDLASASVARPSTGRHPQRAGRRLHAAGANREAVAEWKLAVQREPGLFDAIFDLGTVLCKAGRRDEARPYLERFGGRGAAAPLNADIAKVSALLK